MTAHYECDCGHKWTARVEGGLLRPGKPLPYQHSDNCPSCGSKYFRWTNYERGKR